MNYKIVSTKRISTIFLAIVLVAGTIALASPSFIVETAQASSDREKDYDDDDDDNKKSYGKDRDRDDKLRDYDKDYDEEDRKSYGKDDRDKSKKDSRKSVFINKLKCNNINVNLNGVDVDLGLPNGMLQ